MRNRASILIGLLWCVALLSLVVVGVLYTARMDLMVGKNYADKIQARYLALAGVEKAKALLYKNAQDRSHSRKNHSGEFYDSAADFKEVAFGRGTYSIMHRGRTDEGGGVIYGVSDEESRMNLNTVDSDTLQKIKGLTSDNAAAILGWRGQGSSDQEKDYYMSLRPPYMPRLGAFQTIRELLMVRTISPDQVYGRDNHQNGLLVADDSEDGPPKYPDSVATEDLGWAGILTVDSAVKNVNAAGESRVDVQNADETTLTTVHGITPQIAHAIVTYRSKNRFSSIADLLDVTPSNNQNGGIPRGQGSSSGGSSGDNSGGSVVNVNLLADIADDITTSGDGPQPGAININTASAEVLECLPGVDENLAQAIISYRRSSGFFDNVAGLFKVDGMTRDIFKQLAPAVTTRSETYRILAEGRVTSTGARQRIQEIVRINLDGVKVLSYREDDL